jgi:hypothetical protein
MFLMIDPIFVKYSPQEDRRCFKEAFAESSNVLDKITKAAGKNRQMRAHSSNDTLMNTSQIP